MVKAIKIIEAALAQNKAKDLKLNGSYCGKEGHYYNFKFDWAGRLVCSFRYAEKTPSGMYRSSDGIYINTANQSIFFEN